MDNSAAQLQSEFKETLNGAANDQMELDDEQAQKPYVLRALTSAFELQVFFFY